MADWRNAIDPDQTEPDIDYAAHEKLVERVARALAKENNPYSKNPSVWELYKFAARAAIEAMDVAAIIDDRKPPAGEQIGEVADTGNRLDAREPAPTMFLVESDRAVCFGGRWHGWLFWLHPNGNWVSARKLTETETTIDPLFSMMEPSSRVDLELRIR